MFKELLPTLPRAVVLVGFSCAYAGEYTMKDPGTLGGAGSTGEAINNNGQTRR